MQARVAVNELNNRIFLTDRTTAERTGHDRCDKNPAACRMEAETEEEVPGDRPPTNTTEAATGSIPDHRDQ